MRVYLAFTALCLGLSSVHAEGPLPSHCRGDEHGVLSAWMGPVHPTEAGWRNTKRGKLLSLCADMPKEPFSKLSYRYGRPGQVEFEVVVPSASPFGIDSRSTSPHTGNDIVFFRNGAYPYYVSIATAQGRGVSWLVFKGSKEMVSHFSGSV